MKIFKYLLFIILLIIIGGGIYFGTQESKYTIINSREVQAPPQVVFQQVNNLENWENWFSSQPAQGDLRISVSEQAAGEGASLSVDGKKSEQYSIIKVIPDTEIVLDWDFELPSGKQHAEQRWTFGKTDEGTKINLQVQGEFSLADKVYNAFKKNEFQNSVSANQERELAALSEAVLKEMNRYSIHVDGITEYGGGYYMYVTTAARQNEILLKKDSMFQLVLDFIKNNNLQAAGEPLLIYNEIDDQNQTVIFSAGIPIKEKVITPEGSPVICSFMEPVLAVKTTLKGNYKYLSEAYTQAQLYIEQNNLNQDSDSRMFETFPNSPEVIPNPAEWLTSIYIPISRTDSETNFFP